MILEISTPLNSALTSCLDSLECFIHSFTWNSRLDKMEREFGSQQVYCMLFTSACQASGLVLLRIV